MTIPNYPVADVEFVLHLPAEPYEPPLAMVKAMVAIEAHEKALAIQKRQAAALDMVPEILARLDRGEVTAQPSPPLASSQPESALSPLRKAAVEACQRHAAGEAWAEVLRDVERKYNLPRTSHETLVAYLKPYKRPKWLCAALAVTTSP
jgi:hypothetical protein